MSAEVAERRALVFARNPNATSLERDIVVGLSTKLFEIWAALSEAGPTGMCRKCLNESVTGGVGDNGSGPLRDLRDAGFALPAGQRRDNACLIHPGKVTWDTLQNPMPQIDEARKRAQYSNKSWAAIRKTLGDRDAYTGVNADQVDHRVPFGRITGEEPPVDVTDAAKIRARYMPLSGPHNSLKRQKCETCKDTNRRPVFLGIPFWHEGSEVYDTSVGCRGCGWAYPEDWKTAVLAAALGAEDDEAVQCSLVGPGHGCDYERLLHVHSERPWDLVQVIPDPAGNGRIVVVGPSGEVDDLWHHDPHRILTLLGSPSGSIRRIRGTDVLLGVDARRKLYLFFCDRSGSSPCRDE